MNAQQKRATFIITWAAGGVALLVSLALPVGYLAVGLRGIDLLISAKAAVRAEKASQVIANAPDSWKIDIHHLDATLQNNPMHDEGERSVVRDLQGSIVVEFGTFPAGFALTETRGLYDSGELAGYLDVRYSLFPLLQETGWVAVLASLMGAGAFLVFRQQPLRALDRALHTLVESEERYRRLVERTSAVAYSYKIGDDDLSYVAPQASKLLGYSLGDLMSGQFWFDHMHPDDRPEVQRLGAVMAQDQRDYSLEYRMITGDGQVIWVRDVITFDRDPDGRRFVHGIIIDITDQKRSEAAIRESEARFRAMADTMPALLWVADPEEKTVFVNKPWLDYTGRAFEDELGDGSLDDIHPDDRERTIAAFATACENRESVTLEYRLVGKDGQCQWVLDTSTPRFAPDGEYLGHIGVLVDIEERRQLQSQLAQAQKMEAVGQLTGGVAHDFNNLLTVITLNLQLLDGSLDNTDQRKKMIGTVLHAAGRGAELTHQLLAFSRRQVLTPKVVDVNELVARMDGLLRRTLVEAIRIESVPATDLWLTEIDPGQLETALLNLAINARDAMPGSGTLTVETANVLIDADYASRHQDVAPGPYVMLAVSDTGTGMSQQTIERAFEPFYTTKEVGKGSGLGLSMVQGFVKQSGGHVKIYSELGVGTTVKLHLPRASGTAREPSAEAAEAPRNEAAATETVLVVEDNPDLREAAVTVLTSLGYGVLQAADGASALAAIGDHPGIDLLFTDVIMAGGMNGAALAAAVRERRPGIKVLYTSGYAENAIVHNGHLDDGAAWIAKPYRATELAFKIRQVLEA